MTVDTGELFIQIFKRMNDVRVEGERVYCSGGSASCQKCASAAYNASLTGLEFAAGIPGTLGGAVRMNAGAYGGEMKQVLESAVVLTQEGELMTTLRWKNWDLLTVPVW